MSHATPSPVRFSLMFAILAENETRVCLFHLQRCGILPPDATSADAQSYYEDENKIARYCPNCAGHDSCPLVQVYK